MMDRFLQGLCGVDAPVCMLWNGEY